MSLNISHIINQISENNNIEFLFNPIKIANFTFIEFDRPQEDLNYLSDNIKNIDSLNKFESIYKNILTVFEFSKLNNDELKSILKTILSLFYEYKILSDGGNNVGAKFLNNDYISNKLSTYWDSSKKSFLICPVEIFHGGSAKFNETTPLKFQYNLAFDEKENFMRYKLSFNFSSRNKISDGISCPVEISFFKKGDIYLYEFSANKSGFKSYNLDYFHSLNDLNKSLCHSVSKFIFEAYYKDRIKSLTDEDIDFKDFNLATYETLFEMAKI